MKKVFAGMSFAIMTLTFGIVQGADVVPPEIDIPGTQPGEVTLESANRCLNCHSGYAADPRTEPGFGWMGSAMGNAGRDPIFWATVAIAEQDFDGAGDLCIRCHSSGGWMAGRSTPTDGSGLRASDDNGIDCDTCHQMTNPDMSEFPGVMNDPFIANQEDSLDPVQVLEAYYGSGMYVLSNEYGKLGPYAEDDAVARHRMSQSNFHRGQDFCGTCHDVSNSAVGDLAPNAGTQLTNAEADAAVINSYDFPPLGSPNLFGPREEKAAFNNPPYAYGVVERTFSEYKSSPLSTTLVDAFTTLPADLQDARGSLYNAYMAATDNNRGTADYADGSSQRTFSCQTCHLRASSGFGCDKNNAPERDDLPMHDMTGGNYWIYPLVQWQDQQGTLRLGDGLTADQIAAMADGTARAGEHLTRAATLDVSGDTVRITNMTGHKVITGYPEGRRMWLNIKWYDENNGLLQEDGAYGPLGVSFEYPDPVSGQLVSFEPESILDLSGANTRIYEVHPAITQDWAAILVSVEALNHSQTPVGFNRLNGQVTKTLGNLAAQEPGTYETSFHFVLNNYVAADNRIPPYRMSYDEARKRNALPVPDTQYGGSPGGVYNYWDEISLNPPTAAVSADITLYYQGTSWEYTQFLWLANTTPVGAFLADEGINFLDAWVKTGMVKPYVMASATWGEAGCIPSPEGPFADPTCEDTIDNDCDGFIDGDDPDCAASVVCADFNDNRKACRSAGCHYTNRSGICSP